MCFLENFTKTKGSLTCMTFFSLQALVGEKACYQSISSCGGQIFYLGTKVSVGSF